MIPHQTAKRKPAAAAPRTGEGEKLRRGEGEKRRRGETEKLRRGEAEKRRRWRLEAEGVGFAFHVVKLSPKPLAQDILVCLKKLVEDGLVNVAASQGELKPGPSIPLRPGPSS